MSHPKRIPKKQMLSPAKKTASKPPVKKTSDMPRNNCSRGRRIAPANDAISQAKPKAMSSAEQRAYVLSVLAGGGQSSYFFRNNGCYQVPTRVHELRKLGHDIRTTLVTIVDAESWSHPRCAFYEMGDQGQLRFDFDKGVPASNETVADSITPAKNGLKP